MERLVYLIFKIIDAIESIPYNLEYVWFIVTYPFVLGWIHLKYGCIGLKHRAIRNRAKRGTRG